MRLAHLFSMAVIPAASLVLYCLLAFGCQAQESAPLPAPPKGKTWTLFWNDEFKGSRLDTKKWRVAPSQFRNGGYWVPKAVSLNGKGHLVISAWVRNHRIVTGEVSTLGTFEPTYGYFVARCKISDLAGTRDGFWLQSRKINLIGDSSNPTEIDIFEAPGRDGWVEFNVHWGGYKTRHQTAGVIAPLRIDFAQFHDFGLWWDSKSYRFYIDGKLLWTTTAGGVSKGPEYIRLSVAPTRSDPHQPPNLARISSPGKDLFVVDYVRVYQLAN